MPRRSEFHPAAAHRDLRTRKNRAISKLEATGSAQRLERRLADSEHDQERDRRRRTPNHSLALCRRPLVRLQLHRGRRPLPVEVKAEYEDFREVRFYKRGRHVEQDVAPAKFNSVTALAPRQQIPRQEGPKRNARLALR
jgi:hypothetical protein